MKDEKCWKMQDWIRMSLIFKENDYRIGFRGVGTNEGKVKKEWEEILFGRKDSL